VADDTQKLEAMIKRLEPLLMRLGAPREVLPACLCIYLGEAHSQGSSLAQVIVSMLQMATVIWGENFNPQEVAKAIADWAVEHAARTEAPLSAYEQGLVAAVRKPPEGDPS
jgi:hypothetical protein